MISRRPLAKISAFGISSLQRHNPVMVAWWSATFPGFGHFLLHQYIRATFLTLSEVVFNTLARINEAVVYTFCGQFQLAKAVIEPRWVLGYIVIYFIAIWDSYRSAIYQNKLCQLAEWENEPLPSLRLYASEIQYVEQKKPHVAALYSFFFPGWGQLYNQRFGLAFYAIFWWWVYVTLSHAHESVIYMLNGRLADANLVLRPHWLLFMPSVMGGSIYHAYITTIEHNRLFRLEQRQHLSNRYRCSAVRLFDRPGGSV